MSTRRWRSIGTAACATQGWRRSGRDLGRSTRCSRRSDRTREGVRMRKSIVGLILMAAGGAVTAQPAGPAETNTRTALERIARIDPRLHSVLAVDPTAIDQARRVDASGLRGPLAGQPVLIKGN